MKKIPTLFERVYQCGKIVDIKPNVTPGFEWVLNGEGVATVKWDGACCAIINGELWKRYDAKKGKKPPEGAIPCCDPDPVTGHWPHWVKCDPNNPADKWFFAADEEVQYTKTQIVPFRSYEAIGIHFNGNPHQVNYDTLIPHGIHEIDVERSFNGILEYLKDNYIEGIVFWKDGEPQCKIKRSDFGFPWNKKDAIKTEVLNEQIQC